MHNEDLTVLEQGPSNEEYLDTLRYLGITDAEAREIVKKRNNQKCFHCERVSETIDPQTGFCPYCQDLLCRKCPECGHFNFRYDGLFRTRRVCVVCRARLMGAEMHYNPKDDPKIINGPQEAHGFKVGDVVEYTNPAGLKFGPHRVVGFRLPESDFLPDNVVYIDSDSPWFPVKATSLTRIFTQKCRNCERESDNIDPQTGFCPHCLDLLCRKCPECGQYYLLEDRYCHCG